MVSIWSGLNFLTCIIYEFPIMVPSIVIHCYFYSLITGLIILGKALSFSFFILLLTPALPLFFWLSRPYEMALYYDSMIVWWRKNVLY
jgi:hypothetical protein